VSYLFSENGRDGIWGSEKWYMDSEGRKGILVLEGFGGARVYFIYIFRLQIFVYIIKRILAFCCNGLSNWPQKGLWYVRVGEWYLVVWER